MCEPTLSKNFLRSINEMREKKMIQEVFGMFKYMWENDIISDKTHTKSHTERKENTCVSCACVQKILYIIESIIAETSFATTNENI